MTPWDKILKLLLVKNELKIIECLSLEKIFEPSLGFLIALPTNMRPGWKGLPRRNPIVYPAKIAMMKKKSFTTLTLGPKL